MLIGLGAAGSLAISGALYYALQTRNGGQGQELYATDNRSTPDGLNALPKDYGGVPKLGPPLPSDLGRSILNAQNAGQPVPAPGIVTPNAGPVGPTPEEQRRAQELEAARLAKLFASTETRPASGGAAMSSMATATPPTDLGSLGLAPQPATPSAQERQLAFLNQTPDKRTVAPDRVAAPASPNVLQAGAVIAAALITGIRSDLPGQITAQVTENVYDSPTGRILLVPQGTCVVGQYDNGVGFGQRRVLLIWTRLILPTAARSFSNASPAPMPKATPTLRMASIITVGISPRPPVSRPCSASTRRPDRPTTRATSPAPSARARRTASPKSVGRWSAVNSTSPRRSLFGPTSPSGCW